MARSSASAGVTDVDYACKRSRPSVPVAGVRFSTCPPSAQRGLDLLGEFAARLDVDGLDRSSRGDYPHLRILGKILTQPARDLSGLCRCSKRCRTSASRAGLASGLAWLGRLRLTSATSWLARAVPRPCLAPVDLAVDRVNARPSRPAARPGVHRFRAVLPTGSGR